MPICGSPSVTNQIRLKSLFTIIQTVQRQTAVAAYFQVSSYCCLPLHDREDISARLLFT